MPVLVPQPVTSTAYEAPSVAAMLTRDCTPEPHASSLAPRHVKSAWEAGQLPPAPAADTTISESKVVPVHVSSVSRLPTGALAGTVTRMRFSPVRALNVTPPHVPPNVSREFTVVPE